MEELFWYMQESLFPLLDVNKEGTVEIKFSALILHYDILSLLNLSSELYLIVHHEGTVKNILSVVLLIYLYQ